MSKPPPYEPTDWMRRAIADRVKQAEPVLRVTPRETLVMIPLADPPEDATAAERERWEFGCDRCGVDSRPNLYTGAITVLRYGHRITITFGLCDACRDLERIR